MPRKPCRTVFPQDPGQNIAADLAEHDLSFVRALRGSQSNPCPFVLNVNVLAMLADPEDAWQRPESYADLAGLLDALADHHAVQLHHIPDSFRPMMPNADLLPHDAWVCVVEI